MNSTANILVVDDEPLVRGTISALLERENFKAFPCEAGEEALAKIQTVAVEAAIVDLNMPGMSGLELTRALKEKDPDIEIIILTGSATLESAIQAIHEQVFEYLCKPIEMAVLIRSLNRALERRHLVLENRELMRQLEMERNGLKKQVSAAKRALERQLTGSSVFVGESPQIADVRRFISEVAPDDITVLVRGESGTGKDVVARLIHEASDRKVTGEFHKINCPTLPETLLESELFGHEEGSFTGADRKKPGRFELADGGTVFLDEIGELPPSLQAKLLQVIEHKQFMRVGGSKTIHVDVRIVAATNAPLEAMIADGRFRADLYYRLNEYSINIPPLRERSGDIPLLAMHFFDRFKARSNAKDLNLNNGIMEILMRHKWPGNVRELEAVIRRYVLSGREETIYSALGNFTAPPAARPLEKSIVRSVNTLDEMEAQTLLRVLTDVRWNQRRAAENLGISYSALRRRIAKHGLRSR